MKKFENLGRMLSKEEQRQILGGDAPGCTCNGAGDRLAHCCEGFGACVDEAWGGCSSGSCPANYTCKEYCVKSNGTTCWT